MLTAGPTSCACRTSTNVPVRPERGNLGACLPLTRRRDPDARQERWRVFYGDVQVGTIGMRSGIPVGVDQWDWTCGFYPASERGRLERGIAPDFLTARAAFEAAWHRLLPTLTESDFQEYRRERALRAWKYEFLTTEPRPLEAIKARYEGNGPERFSALGQQTISRTLCASCQFFRGGHDGSKPLAKRTGRRIRSCPEASRRARAQSQILQTRGKSDT